jgi:cysteine desulfurase
MSVYLDHNATTALDEAVLEAMMPYLTSIYGNPSSGHAAGRQARSAIDRAREQVAALVHAQPSQVVFTSGGTEANNLALKGIAATFAPGALAVSAVEHSSVLESARTLERHGWRVRPIAVDGEGRVTPEALAAALTEPGMRLISVMTANNETGVIQDVASLAQRARSRGILFHTDAVQAAGKIELDFSTSGVHLMSISAHKIGGPKGVGALIVDGGVDLEPLLDGGGHEKGRRSGTENVAGIAGFGAAAQKAAQGIAVCADHCRRLQSRLEARLRAIPGVVIFSAGAERLPNTVFFGVDGVDGGTLALALDQAGFEVSSGSACGTARAEPSHVLLAMGVDRERAHGAVRVSMGMQNTAAEIDAFSEALERELGSLRRLVSRGTGTI